MNPAAAVCCHCHLFFKNYRTAVCVEEGMPYTALDGSTQWRSYKLWQADLKKCEGCGAEILTGFGHGPLAEHYQADYEQQLEQLQPLFRIDDCGPGPYCPKATASEDESGRRRPVDISAADYDGD